MAQRNMNFAFTLFSFIKIVHRVLFFATTEMKAILLLRTCIQGCEGGKKQMLVDDNLGISSVCISAIYYLIYKS